MNKLNRKFTVAPMLDWTDRHCRYFHRLLSKQAVLYTEMVTTGALLHGDPERHLRFNPAEHPVALQLGGSDPQEMAECARLAESYGYDEVNINVGCPSERVQKGAFGACLMAEPQLIADCVAAMRAAVTIPVTVKNRIGIDDQDDYGGLHQFISTVSQAGCETFIIHARKAWLQGLSPKENRDIPPLRYELVYQIKQEFPQLEIIINGGITTLEQCQQHLQHVDGVMVGREAYHNPWLLAQVDPLIYGIDAPFLDRKAVLEAFLDYVQAQQAAGVALNHLSRHILGLFQGMPGARGFRRLISENAHKADAGIELLREAAKKIA
ncbi:MAG: tRNA dihydrouridine(20/20a) synthase DusA [Pseudomonadota bacterium]|jgi:tRNA-dihydrouridine synthase A|uniref:tRNA-dihydrouridine(20/20a) synthase n=1 Tax=Thiothrix fructosivorans TaxID=111770 RepID=A0A8B0SH63_9GAMM|nr:tRNA dihydrouridine(20/20a) synthase DusA [Thiothrix fructosivorans]MBO0613094.1 tRNA dihydrouridine(20/20a) synthase DusA [Thiothrix fructosivorans]QTX11463.1 tRNA dihydrouridine(20/20a) synthase DusA [Thiothrix fructosivorans]